MSDSMPEEWRPVIDWEDFYEVSNHGAVRSLFRVVRARDGGQRDVPGRVLRPGMDPCGYHRVSLNAFGSRQTRKVHRLVLEAFVGPCPDGMMACHNNGIRNDNRIENLRWDTGSSNMYDRVRHGNDHNVAKTTCPQGHPYEGRNLIVRPGNKRVCRKCSNAATAAYHKNNPADLSRRTHGRVGTYTAGCRCKDCKSASVEWRNKRTKTGVSK